MVLTKNESEVGTYIMGYSNKLSILRSWVPEDATYTDITDYIWKSSNPEVATVTDYGLVTTHAPGTARITYRSRWDQG